MIWSWILPIQDYLYALTDTGGLFKNDLNSGAGG